MTTDKTPLCLPSDGFHVPCPCCDTEIHVHLGRFEIHDLLDGRPYGLEKLPQRPDGSRVLTCKDCAEDAAAVVQAGNRFDVGLLREAKAEALNERVRMTDWSGLLEHIVELRRGAMHLAASDGLESPHAAPAVMEPVNVWPEAWAQVAEFESLLLLKCYREAEQRRQRRLAKEESRRLRGTLGLRVAGADDDEELDF